MSADAITRPAHVQPFFDALEAADGAYTAAVQAAVAGHGDWGHVREAGEAVRQARSALKQATK